MKNALSHLHRAFFITIIEASNLDYAILRPGWFTNKDEIDYETAQKSESFKGHVVSRKRMADLIVKLAFTPPWKFVAVWV